MANMQANVQANYQLNQPVLAIPPAAPQAGPVAIEIQILVPPRRTNIPIVQVLATLLPGRVDDPRILFREALQQGYAAALQQARRPPNPTEDTVQIQIRHEGILANGNMWGTPSIFIANALDQLVTLWDNAMQSGDMVDLSLGALEMYLTFTFYGQGPLVQAEAPYVRMGARPRRGEYEIIKKKMYYQNINDDWYTTTNALKKVPFTDENMCFPMAFMYCQCRRIHFGGGGHQVVKVSETNAFGILPTYREKYITSKWYAMENPAQFLEIGEQDFHYIQVYLPHLVFQGEDILSEDGLDNVVRSTYWMTLFYPYRQLAKTVNRRKTRVNPHQIYSLEDASIGYHRNAWIQCWLFAAQLVHQHVQRKLFREVDHTDFFDCCQAYADVFHVHIHILRVETMMSQTHFFRPETRRLLEPTQDHIYILFGDAEGNFEHCHAITNRRRLDRSIWLPYRKQCGVYNYCDFCSKSFSGVQDHEKGCLHLTQCFR